MADEKPEPLENKRIGIDCNFEEGDRTAISVYRDKDGDFFEAKDIKSACEFYLRYRNNPELFEKEMEMYKDVISKLRSEWHNWEEHYDKWLFKLAFKDVFKEVKIK